MDWIPVNVAASTITDLLTEGNGDGEGGKERYQVSNIVNPHQIGWGELVDMLQEAGSKSVTGKKEMEVISMKEWVARLSKLADRGVCPDEVPGLRLLHFFEGMVGGEEEEDGRVFETEKTQAVSGALAACEAFNGGWLDENVRVWREIGFLKK